MSERNFGELAMSMRSTGSVRFIGDEYKPKNPVNTSPDNIASQILYEVFDSEPEKFRKDDRPERMEVRFHWRDLPEIDRKNLLLSCEEKIRNHAIARERGIENNVFDLIYFYLNLQVT